MEFDITRQNGDVYTVLVDDQDADVFRAHRWHVSVRPGRVYVATRIANRVVYLHGLLMDAALVDHINGNGLDNRRANLRAASKQQNAANAKVDKTGMSSRFKGVCWDKGRQRWMAYIHVDGRFRSLGRHDSEIVAAAAYDKAAVEFFGEFAHTNAMAS